MVRELAVAVGERATVPDPPLVIEQWSRFYLRIAVTPPETGYGWDATKTATDAIMQIRDSVSSSTVLLELSTEEDEYITISGTEEAPIITIDIPASVTKDISLLNPNTDRGDKQREIGTGVYDLRVTLDDGNDYRLIEGTISVSRAVTRAAVD